MLLCIQYTQNIMFQYMLQQSVDSKMHTSFTVNHMIEDQIGEIITGYFYFKFFLACVYISMKYCGKNFKDESEPYRLKCPFLYFLVWFFIYTDTNNVCKLHLNCFDPFSI